MMVDTSNTAVNATSNAAVNRSVNKGIINPSKNLAASKDSVASAATVMKKRKVPNLPQIRVLIDSDSNDSPQKNFGILEDETVIKMPGMGRAD